MKTTSIRIFSMLLALLMLLSFAACNKNGGNTEETTEKKQEATDSSEIETEGDEPLELPDVNYGGKEIRILARGEAQEYLHKELFFDGTAGQSNVDDTVFKRISLIEETYGVTVTLDKKRDVGDSSVDMWVTVNSLSASQNDTYHIIAQHGRNMSSYATNGYLGDWNYLTYVNQEASWWSQDARKQWTTPSGGIYMMIGDISYLSVGNAVGMFFNKETIQNLGLDMPYTLVDEGKWTMEAFQNYAKLADESLNGDGSGTLDTDTFGYAAGWWRGPMNIVYSTNNRWLEVSEDDVSIVPATGNELQDAFDNYFDFLFESGACVLYKSDYAKADAAFLSGKVAFYEEIVLKADVFSSEGMKFGLLPMPKYSEDVDKNYSFVNSATNVFGVPTVVAGNMEIAEMVSVFLEAMAYHGQKMVLPVYYKDILTYGTLTDEESVRMMDAIHDGLTFDLGMYLLQYMELADIGYIMASESASRNFATVYASLVTQAQTRVDKWLEIE